ncbi:MAG TPA: MerR family transcriptional regulator, partial [Nocardioides sp.]|uniref:MerR family transcriptional regulator n=1 Tax=Nocardioides sp. TaxID=35761 RepID=UPI002CE8BB8A
MYTIKHAAELTGIAVPTLRAWERRYGVVAPVRTAAGYRLYDEGAVQSLRTMQTLVQEGWAPRQAAEETRRRAAEGLPPAPITEGPDTSEGRGGDDLAADARALVAAGVGLDAAAVAAVLDRRFSLTSFETAVDDWLMPALHALGEAWARGELSVAGEHLVAHAVHRRLGAAYEAGGRVASGPRVVVGLPPGAHHDLGVLAFAAAARRAGVPTTYLGADLPAADWVSATAGADTRGAVLAVSRTEDLPALDAVVAALRTGRPGLLVAVGGSLQDSDPDALYG